MRLYEVGEAATILEAVCKTGVMNEKFVRDLCSIAKSRVREVNKTELIQLTKYAVYA